MLTRREFVASIFAVAAETSLRGRDGSPSRPSASLSTRHLRWAVSSGLWRHPRVPFDDILAVMEDTGFEGVRLVDFPQCLTEYDLTVPKLERLLSRRNRRVFTVSWHGRLQDPSARQSDLASARRAMEFLRNFGATHLVVFPPDRKDLSPRAFQVLCQRCNEVGELAGEMGFTAGLHNHLDEMVQTQDEVDRFMAMTDPKLFGFSPDTAHLDLAGCDVVGTLERYKHRLLSLDYKDSRWDPTHSFMKSIYDLGDGEVDFPACHRILKSVGFSGWICVDLDTARQGPLVSFRRSAEYIRSRLEPIYR